MSEPSYRLPCHQRFAYGVGHVLNDLCAAMWFCYLLVYFHNVLNFSNALAGYVMLLGQVGDALSTPFVGLEVDRTQGIGKYGKRKSWHLIGKWLSLFPLEENPHPKTNNSHHLNCI